MVTADELVEMKCIHRETGLNRDEIAEYLQLVPRWGQLDGKIARTYAFKNYYETLAFVNAIAYIIHAEDHHPELVVTYNRCTAKFDTHSVNEGKGGVSVNDFICAAKLDAIFEQSFA